MTKYSPIAPIGLLQQLHDDRLLDNYLLLLAHDVLEHDQAYLKLIEEWEETSLQPTTIIMDNGTIENGAPVSLEDLMEAAALVDANVVVGPDVVGDYEETKKLMMEQGDIIRGSYKMMLIPQGETLEMACECVRWMDERFPTPEEQWWGIPRWMANDFGTRQGVITYINNYARGSGEIKIHLLGMSEDLDDDLRCAKTLSVVGIDSANPMVLGYLHESIEDPQRPKHPERGDYWSSDYLHPLMSDNVRWVHNALAI